MLVHNRGRKGELGLGTHMGGVVFYALHNSHLRHSDHKHAAEDIYSAETIFNRSVIWIFFGFGHAFERDRLRGKTVHAHFHAVAGFSIRRLSRRDGCFVVCLS